LSENERPIVIASRRSRLARVQAEAVGAELERLNPGVDVVYRWIESEGDQQLTAALADSGGKGLFARAIEKALLVNQADVAVHSYKDLPAEITPGLSIVAVPLRADPRDCLIADKSVDSLDDLPEAATVGTASPRRAAQLKRLRPDLEIGLLRGNVETRLRRVLQEHRFHATLLAAAGLSRMGLAEHAHLPLDPAVFLPAASQGALAIQCRTDDELTRARCAGLNHPQTAAAVNAERQVVAALHGDCHSPIAVLGELSDSGRLILRARVLSLDGKQCLESRADDDAAAANTIVERVVADLQEQGSERVLRIR